MRISYSSAKAYWDGRVDDCLRIMTHQETALPIITELELKKVRGMAMGNGYHSAWELESKLTGKLPVIFKVPIELNVVATELKLNKELMNGDTLSGVIDAVLINPDIPMVVLADYKSSLSYDPRQAETYQYLVYNNPQWIEAVGDFNPTHAMYLCLNKKTGEVENSLIQLSYPKTEEDWELPSSTTYTRGGNWILTIINELRNDERAMEYLKEQGIEV
jgi:hypothetical protein